MGAKGLRDLLFEYTHIQGLFCFENRKTIFEGVDSRFKFVVLTFEKTSVPRLLAVGESNASAPPDDLLAPTRTGAQGTTRFPAAFMRHDVVELERFPSDGALWLDVELIRKLAPDSHSLMEFKSELDVEIAQKMLRFPMLGARLEGKWNCVLARELHMTDDSHLFKNEAAPGRLPLYEGKMVWQFDSDYAKPRYWIDDHEGRLSLLGRDAGDDRILDYQTYRLGFRDIARNTDTRTLICSVTAQTFHGNKLPALRIFDGDGERLITNLEQLFLCAVWNSFVVDWMVRQKVTATLNFFYLYQLPVPRIGHGDSAIAAYAERAARLICTAPKFDALANEAGLRDHRDGATEPAERARLRAELDGLVAHLYGLSEDEFVHILATFPLVPEPVKQAARNAYRDVERGLIR